MNRPSTAMTTKPLMNFQLTPSTSVKSCFRCGAEFPTSDRERVCWRCRKPKTDSRSNTARQVTFRERQIISLVAEGKTNKEIAFQLLLTEGTIKEYLNRIFRKFGVSNRTELAVRALTQTTPVEESQFERLPACEKRSLVI